MSITKTYNVVLNGNAVQVFTDAELARVRYGRARLGTIEARSKNDVYERIHNFVKQMLQADGELNERVKPVDTSTAYTQDVGDA